MKSVSSPASVKSVCAASSVMRLQALIAVAGHGGGGDREQRAAEAIADGMHLLVRHDGGDRIERRHDAELPVVLHPESRSSFVGFFQEIMKTVNPCSVR